MDSVRFLTGLSAVLVATVAVASSRISIISEHQADKSWTYAPDKPRVVPGYPDGVPDRSQDVCVNIGYQIGADGRTSQFTEMKSWSGATPDREPKREQVQAFVQIAAAAVSRWQFVPVSGKPRPIYTSASFAFEGSKRLPGEAIRAHCRIDDLNAFVDQATRRPQESGMRSRYERGLQEAIRCTSFSSACVLAAD